MDLSTILSGSVSKLRIVYPDPSRPVPQVLTESGVDLVKEIPIKSITIEIGAFEFPQITLTVLGVPEVEGRLKALNILPWPPENEESEA